MNTPRFVLFLATISTTVTLSQASLIWNADFSSYDTSGGAVGVTINSTGAYDTISGATTSSVNMSLSSQVAASSSLTGNALQLTMTNTSASGISSTSATIFQGSQPSLGGNGIYILSTDMVRSGSNGISGARSWPATGASATSGSNNTTGTGVSTTPWRFTLVINQTGSALTLPGTLGSLSTNNMAAYYYDGTSYLYLTTTSASSSAVTGFATGFFRSNSTAAGASVTVWYDNMGLWNSASDTVGGTSVLSLAPGTVVPEPSTYLLGLCGIAVAGILHRRRSRQAMTGVPRQLDVH